MKSTTDGRLPSYQKMKACWREWQMAAMQPTDWGAIHRSERAWLATRAALIAEFSRLTGWSNTSGRTATSLAAVGASRPRNEYGGPHSLVDHPWWFTACSPTRPGRSRGYRYPRACVAHLYRELNELPRIEADAAELGLRVQLLSPQWHWYRPGMLVVCYTSLQDEPATAAVTVASSDYEYVCLQAEYPGLWPQHHLLAQHGTICAAAQALRQLV